MSPENSSEPNKVSNNAPDNIVALAENRLHARAERDFTRADQLRAEIENAGWQIADSKDGFTLTPTPEYTVFARLSDLLSHVPSERESATESQNSVSATLIVIVDGWAADVRTCVNAIVEHTAPTVQVLAIDCGNVDGAGDMVQDLSQENNRVVVFHIAQTLQQAGWANCVNAAIARAPGAFIGVLDISTVFQGDALSPLIDVLTQKSDTSTSDESTSQKPIGATGWKGVNVNTADNWRSFDPAAPGSVDAILGYLMVMPAPVAREIGPDPKAVFYRNADMEWSLHLRAAGYDLVIPPGELPLTQARHHGYHDSEPAYREKQSKKTYDRLLTQFRGKPEILHR